jgi:hypothetical protein
MSVTTEVCPDCAETVKPAARVCRFRGYRFDRNHAILIGVHDSGRHSGASHEPSRQAEPPVAVAPSRGPVDRDEADPVSISSTSARPPRVVAKWRVYVPLLLILATIGVMFTPTVFLKSGGKTVGDTRVLGQTVPLVETSFWNAVPVGRWFVIIALILAALACWSIAADLNARKYSTAQGGVSFIYLLTFVALAIIAIRGIFPPTSKTAFPDWGNVAGTWLQALGYDPSSAPPETTGTHFWIFIWPVLFCWLALSRLNRQLRTAVILQKEQAGELWRD